MTTSLNRSCHACGCFCRIWSSGFAWTGTVAWCAQASGTWCTVAQARHTPAHSTAWRPARPLPRLIFTAMEGSFLRLLSLVSPATRWPPDSRSFLTSRSSSPPMGMGPTAPSTTGRGILAPMGTPPRERFQSCQFRLLVLRGAPNQPLPGREGSYGADGSNRVGQQLATVPGAQLVEADRSAAEVVDHDRVVNKGGSLGALL